MKTPAPKIMKLRSKPDRRAGNTHEVIAPDGWRFECELHAQIAGSLEEAEALAREPLEPCPADCPCKED